MYREFFAALPSPLLPLVTMAFFLVAFLAVLAWVFLVRRRGEDAAMAALPLAEDPAGPPASQPAVPHEVRS